MSNTKQNAGAEAPPAIGYVSFPNVSHVLISGSPANVGGMVIVEIGQESTKYHMHRALLVHHSEYFRKALEGPWKEADEGVVRIDDVGIEECECIPSSQTASHSTSAVHQLMLK